jgi:hypothetical protein
MLAVLGKKVKGASATRLGLQHGCNVVSRPLSHHNCSMNSLGRCTVSQFWRRTLISFFRGFYPRGECALFLFLMGRGGLFVLKKNVVRDDPLSYSNASATILAKKHLSITQ